MKRILSLIIIIAALVLSLRAQNASDSYAPVRVTNNTVYFNTMAEGKYLPILWGLDTAWDSESNIVRGTRFIGAENIGIARVSFQPFSYISGTTLTTSLQRTLNTRLKHVALIKGTGNVALALNNDGPIEKVDTRYLNAAESEEAATGYANLIYATMLACQSAGWDVVSVSPLNEPDYTYNGQGTQEDFLAIAKKLKTYPQFNEGKVRISGGNTLNDDKALDWYRYLYDYLDEGNTHQLAGNFDNYADFFRAVRADGKYATADELHNVMEAMVGVEYGMQTGIWWGTAERARGEFCRASFGRRLGYAENRSHWTSGAVYRSPDGKYQAFVGTSERQALPDAYRFVSADRDVFYNGYGPQREYYVSTPGGYNYQQGQTNAECVIDITWGEDVSPVVDGNYMLMNKYSKKVMGISGKAQNGSYPSQYAAGGSTDNLWEVNPVPNNIGGDFSYWTIKLASNTDLKLDVYNFTLNANGRVSLWNGSQGTNEQWYLKYAGDGYFRIFSKHSAMCLALTSTSTADGVRVVQVNEADDPRQLWRFLPSDAPCETEAPAPPTNLQSNPASASIQLTWNASPSADVVSYTILRATDDIDNGQYQTIGRGITGCRFVDNTVDATKVYKYKVKAVDRSVNISAASQAVECAVTDANAVIVNLPFNNDTIDLSPNHFDALHAPSVRLMYVNGRDDEAKSFCCATNSWVQLPYACTNRTAATISAWFYISAKYDNQPLLEMVADETHYVGIIFTKNIEPTIEACNGGEKLQLIGEPTTDKDWHHIAVTIAPERADIYIDGVLSGAIDGGLGFTLADVKPAVNTIGRAMLLYNSYFHGNLQDFTITNYAMSPQEIADAAGRVSGISTVIADSEKRVEFFNLQGQPAANPAGGIFIKRTIDASGSVRTQKVML